MDMLESLASEGDQISLFQGNSNITQAQKKRHFSQEFEQKPFDNMQSE